MRKLLVLLLCALAIFAAVSCKNEPAPVAEKYVVTFDTRGGSIIDSVTLEKGAKVEKPADPILVGSYFGGWFTDAECTTPYDFDAAVTKSITLYSKFAEGTTYRVTSQSTTSSDGNKYDKFILSLKDAGVKPGDVFSLSFRTTEPITQYSIRRVGDDKKFFHEKKVSSSNVYPQFFSSMETGKDGWTTVTYVFPEEGAKTQDDAASAYPKADGNVTGIGFNVYLRNQKMVPGALLELRAIAINGVEVPIAEANMNPNKGEALSTLEVLSWTPRKVTFVTGEGASDIAAVEVPYGQPVSKPADPTLEGKLLYGWYLDDEFKDEFSFDTLIFEDTTLYAKFVDPVTVTFNTYEGTAIAAETIPAGYKAKKPADPTKDGYLFGGWFSDDQYTTAYDFNTAVTANTTIHAKWLYVYVITLNYNDGSNKTATAYAPKDTGKLNADDLRAGRAGYFLDGWYTQAEGGDKIDVTEYTATADTSLFAHWKQPTESYKLTATEASDRFQLRMKKSSFAFLDGFKPGDVFTYLVKFTPVDGTSTITRFRVRGASNYGGTSDFSKGITTADAGDGWIAVTCVFPENADFTENGILMDIRMPQGKNDKDENVDLKFVKKDAEKNIAGDMIEIRAIAFNGQEIAITDSSSSGPYEGVKPSYDKVSLVQ